jgi:hypothetical protein
VSLSLAWACSYKFDYWSRHLQWEHPLFSPIQFSFTALQPAIRGGQRK